MEHADGMSMAEENFLGVIRPDSAPYGLAYEEWTARWWKWALEIPKSRNPVKDLTGKYAGEGQDNDDPVWFLAGSFIGSDGPSDAVKRNCVIPAGKAILIPVSNNASFFLEFPNCKTESELRVTAKSDIDKVTIRMVEIDGVVLTSDRIETPLFSVTLPEDNVLDKPAGPTKGVGDGYWLFLKPLPRGKHNIHFVGSCETAKLFTEAIYEVDVK